MTSDWWEQEDEFCPKFSIFDSKIGKIEQFILGELSNSQKLAYVLLNRSEQFDTNFLKYDKCCLKMSARFSIHRAIGSNYEHGPALHLKLIRSGEEILREYYCKSILLDQSTMKRRVKLLGSLGSILGLSPGQFDPINIGDKMLCIGEQ